MFHKLNFKHSCVQTLHDLNINIGFFLKKGSLIKR